MRKCAVCKKQFDVLYPDLWRYKRGDGGNIRAWFCSWKCLREYDRKNEAKKGERAMAKGKAWNDQVEMGRKLLEVLDKGGDPVEYLKEQGYKNPVHAYENIKNRMREKAPEEAARFPEKKTRRPAKKATVEVAEKLPEPKVELVYDESIAEEYRKEQAAKKAAETPEDWIPAEKVYGICAAEEDEKPIVPAKNVINGMEAEDVQVTAIRVKGLGEFYFDKKFGTVDWRSDVGEEISLTPADWEKLRNEIQRMLKILGAED